MSDYLKELSSEFSENLKLNYDLKKKNWFNIGGKTKIYYKAKNLKELIKFLKKINNLPDSILEIIFFESNIAFLWRENLIFNDLNTINEIFSSLDALNNNE